MSEKRNLKSILAAIYAKPYSLVYVLFMIISLIVVVLGWVYLIIKFVKHPTIVLGAFLIACILYPIFYKLAKGRLKK